MTVSTQEPQQASGDSGRGRLFAGLPDPGSAGSKEILEKIAARIADTRRPGALSSIPAGATYLAQFVAHDLDFRTRNNRDGAPRLDLALIYGDGPEHDGYCYQVPDGPGGARWLLRLGRTRPTTTSPAWGASRDLPRIACPHLDSRTEENRTEVLVPNSFSDSNLLLGQVQTLWMMSHNAIATRLASWLADRAEGAYGGGDSKATAFGLARRINQSIYREVIGTDLLGNWLMPGLPESRPASGSGTAAPPEFLAGVARLGHGLVREIYSLNDSKPVVGLRDIVRHTSTGRPHDLPLTESWLVDFSKFFPVDSDPPQMARAIGPHIARPFATPVGGGDSLTLRDLAACTSGGLLSVAALTEAADLPEGCFAADPARWKAALKEWLEGAGIEGEALERLAADPPLVLFLMLEAEADTDGQTLGALGSVLMGRTLRAALLPRETDEDLAAAMQAVFGSEAPASMAGLIRFLQNFHRYADGARLHSGAEAPSDPADPLPVSGDPKMTDYKTPPTHDPIPRIEVADFRAMGEKVRHWVENPASRPGTAEELRTQLDGIAVVPDRITEVEFCQGTLNKLVLRLPVPEMLLESVDRMTDPTDKGGYPLPQFYSDFYRPGFAREMTPLDLLYSRVGDYTISQCR